jgi:mevalonate kinase
MRASAPAKAILFGEHAVVHGVPAIAVPIAARKTDVDLVETDADREIAIEDARGVETDLAAQMVRLALDQTRTPARGARVKVASTIPLGSGLGSSAALAVALVRAVGGGGALDREEVSRRALELERLAHGTPSGIDSTTIALERPILFEKGKPPAPLKLKSALRLAIGVLPRTGTTASLVAGVRRLKDEDAGRFRAALEGIRTAVDAARRALTAGDLGTLAVTIDGNRRMLEVLGVSTPEVEKACDAAVAAGALGAKLSGAGGGGAVLAFLGPKSDSDRVLGALKDCGAADTFVTEVPPS